MKTIETLKKLKVLLGNDKIIITGSTALALHGLTKLADAKDLDLLVYKPSDASIEVLNRLQKDKPNKKLKEGNSLKYSFFYEDVKVDIWSLDAEITDYLITTDGIQVSGVLDIVKAKLSYNRPKDWIQLMKLSKLFFSQDKFDGALSSIPTDDVDEYDDED